jgi:hypothetical protein
MGTVIVQPGPNRVVDFSTPTFDVGWAISQGVQGFLMYVDGTLSRGGDLSWKYWTPARMAQVHSLGGLTGVIFESSAARCLDGYQAGATDARATLDDLAILDYPPDLPVICASFDTGVIDDTDAARDAAFAYWDGWIATLGRPTGPYGGTKIAQYALAHGATVFAQAAAPAWSDLYPSPLATLWQRLGYMIDPNGVDADRNDVLQPFPMWDGRPPAKDNDDMPTIIRFSDADAVFETVTDPRVAGWAAKWTGPGSDPKVLPRLAASAKLGAHEVSGTVADLAPGFALIGQPGDIQDSRHKWTAADFAAVLPEPTSSGGVCNAPTTISLTGKLS